MRTETQSMKYTEVISTGSGDLVDYEVIQQLASNDTWLKYHTPVVSYRSGNYRYQSDIADATYRMHVQSGEVTGVDLPNGVGSVTVTMPFKHDGPGNPVITGTWVGGPPALVHIVSIDPTMQIVKFGIVQYPPPPTGTTTAHGGRLYWIAVTKSNS